MSRGAALLPVLLALALVGPRPSLSATKSFIEDSIVNPTAFYPEGPQIVDDGLLVAEMPKNRIVHVANGEIRTVWQAAGCGPTSVKKIPSGGYWVLCHLGHYVARVGEKFETLRVWRHTTSGRRIAWPNDASVDLRGNLYLSSAGLFALHAPAEGRVIAIDAATGTASELAAGLRYANGILVQEKRRRVLVSEHLSRRVLAFPMLEKGGLGEPSVFFDFRNAPPVNAPFEQSGPDGLAAFADGDVCVADYGNGRLLLLSSSGRFLAQTTVRYKFVTNMAITKDQKSIFVLMTQSNETAELHGVVQRFNVRTHR